MTRAYCDGPFGQIHLRVEGTGTPLVLLHQALLSQRQFDAVYAPFVQRGIQAIGIDLPGMGQSDPVMDVPTIAAFAQVLAPVLDHLGIGDAHILGHHTGAQVATEFALMAPERTRSVILNGPLPMEPSERDAGLAYVEAKEKGMAFESDGSHLRTLFENRNAFASDATDWRIATRYVAEAFMGLGPLWHGHYAAFTHDHGARLKALDGPVLILTNTGDTLYPNAQHARQLRPDFAYAELDGGGVDAVDELTDGWVDAVAGFILQL